MTQDISVPDHNTNSAATNIATPSSTHRLTIRVSGQIELPHDDPVFGTYWNPFQYHVLVCGTLPDAVRTAGAGRCDPPESLLREVGARRFSPKTLTIQDASGRLALGGRFFSERIVWSAPVTSDEEALRIRTESEQLRSQAAVEVSWDNYGTAERLREEAELLDTHAVDAAWRIEVLQLVQAKEATGEPILAIRLRR